ncbi:MAG: PilZ domain-containing protein [Armatimonadetes bacterium]|nr:PilZ domain-containing protein [Armatimonadota bacterium]
MTLHEQRQTVRKPTRYVERRRSIRYPVFWSSDLKGSDSTTSGCFGILVDVSLTGAKLSTSSRVAVEKDEPISLQLRIRTKQFSLLAVVVWVKHFDNLTTFGCQFFEPQPELLSLVLQTAHASPLEQSDDERRTHRRIASLITTVNEVLYSPSTFITYESGGALHKQTGTLQNLSLGGACVETFKPLPLKGEIRLKIVFSADLHISVNARIVRSVTKGYVTESGLRFSEMDEQSELVLRAYLSEGGPGSARHEGGQEAT